MNKNGNQELKKGLKRGRVFLACLIAFALVFSQIGVPVFAETDPSVKYWDREAGEEKTASAEVITDNMTEWNDATSQWYVVKGTVTIKKKSESNRLCQVDFGGRGGAQCARWD